MREPARHVRSIADALSIRYNNLVYELKSAGEDVIVLSLGEAFFDIPLHPFATLPTPEIFHYAHSRGVPALRERLASYYFEDYGVPVDPEREIVITAGSKFAIYMALVSLIDPGDEVLVLEPAWVSYVEQIRLCHGRPVLVPHDVPVTELERFVTDRTRVVILNVPNNPSGKRLSADEWSYLHALASERDLHLLCDEAYSEFLPPGETFISGGFGDTAKHHTSICNSMSKNYGMSGWRLGYLIANAELIDQALKVNQHLVTCPASILSYYLVDHFDDLLEVTRPQIAEVVAKRAQVARELDGLGLGYLPGDSTFYLFVSIAGTPLGSDEFCTRLLKERRVSVVPGIGYGDSCDGFVRVSVGTEPMDRVAAGLRAIRELIDETRADGDQNAVRSASTTRV